MGVHAWILGRRGYSCKYYRRREGPHSWVMWGGRAGVPDAKVIGGGWGGGLHACFIGWELGFHAEVTEGGGFMHIL